MNDLSAPLRRSVTARATPGGEAVTRLAVRTEEDRWPTPRGEFLARNRLVHCRSARYGPVAFERARARTR